VGFTAATYSVATAHGFNGVALNVMGPDGTLGAPTVLTDPTLPIANAMTIGLGDARSLVAYSRLIPDSTFGNFQVRFQIVKDDVVPAADGGAGTDGGSDSNPSDGGSLASDGSSIADASSSIDGSKDARDVGDGLQPDMATDAPTAISDGGIPDRVDAGHEITSGRSGCSCGVGSGGLAAWSWVGVAVGLALVRARRRSRA
jgi:hypothetical protein